MPPPVPANLNAQQNAQLSQQLQFHQQHVLAQQQQQQQQFAGIASSGIAGMATSTTPNQQYLSTTLASQKVQQQQAMGTIGAASSTSATTSATSETLLTTQINRFKSYVTMLADTTLVTKDDSKLKAAQELNENFEIILQSPEYPKFLDHCIKNFLKILSEGEPLFISEYNIQQMRKLLLEMINRFPANQELKSHLPSILTTVLRLLNVENEENTLVCLRIIIELHKMYRPPYNAETQKFLQYVKSIYAELPNHLDRIFEPRPMLRVKDLSAINIEQQLKDTFTTTTIQSEMKSQDGTAICYNLIPKGTMSLKVLQELPIIVVLFFQVYKENVKQDIREYITLIMKTITLQPSLQQRQSPSFNKEVFVDFLGAQIKTLSFIAYIIRSHHDDVAVHSELMVKGILGLLELCPQEVCHLRKELLIAIRHILATDLKKKFVHYMEQLFDENILLGNGWTVRDTLRPLAYSTLADLVHHVRQELPLNDLARAVHLFGKIVHDPTLNTTIQTMSCKLLLNLVDCIKNQSKGEKNAVQCRELLMRMLEIFVLKFKTFAKLQLPILIAKSKTPPSPVVPSPTSGSFSNPNSTPTSQTPSLDCKDSMKQEIKQEPELDGANQLPGSVSRPVTRVPGQVESQEKSKFGFPQHQMSYNVADYRNLVKTLVCGVKTITWGCSSINAPAGEQILASKHFTPKDTLVFIRLVKWAMKALDIYQVQLPSATQLQQLQGRPNPNRMMAGQNQNVRTQEEKEVLEHFSGVFSLMPTSVFRDVFSTCISYMVERIHQNAALQTIANTFLANPHTSAVFATVLVEYLLERMTEMGHSLDRSNLYLRLFKVVFGSVTLFKDNEHMLKPHLHQIVNRSMELAMSAKEPYNYFLLLRALFRSIGGGSHDLLYQAFLPLLPNLLEGLNRLQSGLHKAHMKELFVELCLTVPVRLSSLLPYLPMLMDPLVSALNGSHTLVSQGLRTLELCVDNLQPEFLYEHIQPVRADLMQALWRTLRNPDQVAHVAFRVLGKFGGGNRKMMIEPQRLEFNDRENQGPAIIVEFQDHERSIEFPVEKIIETAVNALKSSSTDSFYHKQCWEVIRCYLAASLNLDDRKNTILKLFLYPSFVNDPIEELQGPLYKCPDRQARQTHLTALTGMFVAAAIKELRQDVQPRMVSLVTHYTMVAIAQQAGPFPIRGKNIAPHLDPLVLIDALAVIMAHEEKELCKPGYVALGLILDTATNILGSKEKACQLPLMEYLKKRMCALCYERAWYSKLGGCIAIKFLFERMSTKWVYQHLFTFLKALMFVMMDLTGEVSSGALDMAKTNLKKMLTICIAPVDCKIVTSDLLVAREKALYDITAELVGLVTSPHTLVREQAMYCIRVLAGCNGTKGSDEAYGATIIAPHIEVLTEIIGSGIIDISKASSDKILNVCIVPLDPKVTNAELIAAREKAMFDVTSELARLIVSPQCEAKEQATYCMRILASCRGNIGINVDGAVPSVMTPHIEVLKDIFSSEPFTSVTHVMASHIDILKATIPNWNTDHLERVITLCCLYLDPKTASSTVINVRDKALHDITSELARLASNSSGNTLVKEQALYCLRVFAECNGSSGNDDGTVASIMLPHVEVLKDIVPPTKHQLILQPANAQIGLMDGNTYCMTLTARLFTFDLKLPQHKSFFDELLLLLCKPNESLNKLQCYKGTGNLVMVKKAALRCLATYHRLPKETAEKIFSVLYDALGYENPELQEMGFECMHKFISGYQIDHDLVRATLRALLGSLGDSRNLTLNVVTRLSYLTKLFPTLFHEKLCEQLLQHLTEFLDNLKETKKVTKTGENEQKIATIILIFHRLTSAGPKFISILCELVLETEKQLLVEASSSFREPLMQFLLRYPAETLELFLQDARLKDQQWSRYLLFLIKHNDGKPFRDHLQNQCVSRLITLLLILNPNSASGNVTMADRYELRHQAIRIISLLIKYDDQWLASQAQLVEALKSIWCDDQYQLLHTKVESVDITHWKEPKLIVKILLQYFEHDPNAIDLLFELLRAFCHRFIPDFQFLRDFLENTVAQNYTIEWKRQAFFKFVDNFKNENISQVLKCHIVQLILIPCFSDSGAENMNSLIGNDQHSNVVSVFIYKIIDQKQPFILEDCLRIALLQFSCLLVEQASPHIHDSSSNKQQGNKLRKLMTFAWPCLLGKNCVDATTRYHGHLLLAHIIEKFAIHKKIVLQVFHSLVKAHAQEARTVVKQALEILTPAMPFRMEDGNTMLIHWTKKIIVEEGHSVQQLYHILQLVVRHYKVYYPVRHHLIQYIVSSINRLGFSQTSTIDHKKLAVELAEVVIKWELQRLKDEESTETEIPTPTGGVKRLLDETNLPEKKHLAVAGASGILTNTPGGGQPAGTNPITPKIDTDIRKPIKPKDADAVINFLLRLACQVNDSSGNPISIQQAGGGTPGEVLSKRCVQILKTALKPELWPQKYDLKLDEWFNKLLLTIDVRDANLANISTALELLIFLLTVMKQDQILSSFVHLQTGLGACLHAKENKIINLIHMLLMKLVSLFPIELTGQNFSCQYEQLRVLYSSVGTMITDGLRAYDDDAKPTASSLFGPLMILKACCAKNPACIDKIITAFMKVLQKMTKEHLNPSQSNETSPDKLASDLLILSLDLVKTRVVVMSVEQRKMFIGTILVGLIERTQDIRVMRAIARMLEEWIKGRNPITLQQAPSLREKSILLVKMMQYVEKRFPDDKDLNTQFLELVNYVYSDEQLRTTELAVKLQPAFMSGLRCTVQPAIRAKFFQVLDASMRRRLVDRLLYIICSQAWDTIGAHYWIKQLIELLIVTAVSSKPIAMAANSALLPSVEYAIRLADSKDKEKFIEYLQELTQTPSASLNSGDVKQKPDRIQTIEQHVNQQAEYLSKAREVETGKFLQAATQLCHMDTALAEQVWLNLFPRLWSILYSNQQNTLLPEIVSFISSGAHVIQKDCHPSAINTFVEALSQCNPPIEIKPATMKYLGKAHNLWHRMTLSLEQMTFDQNVPPITNKTKRDSIGDCYDEHDTDSLQLELVESLSDMYSLLCEEDMWSGLWQRHARYRETNMAIAYEQHGFFEQAQGAYMVAMSRCKPDMNITKKETLLWEQHWIRCAKELNQWELLSEYGLSKSERNHFLILESSWREGNWALMKEALTAVEYSSPKEMAWKVNLYRGFLGICNSEERHPQVVERCVELASGLCMREWRRLPKIVGHAHLSLLQAAQQIMELQEAAAQIYQRLVQHAQTVRTPLHDMRAIVKTWKNRLPVIADDLSHWSDIFTWRQHHYQFIAKYYDNVANNKPEASNQTTSNPAMLGVHASAQAIIHFAKIARKHNLTAVCLESLARIYTIPLVPVVDIFQKLRQQVKCYLHMAASDNNKNALEEGYKVIEITNLQTFTDDMKAEYYALKGLLMSQLGKTEEANKAFSAAVQLHDNLVKAWALWGEYLEALFIRDRTISIGYSAITCFLHSCRHNNETKSRKYLAKVLWLLTYDDEKMSLLEALDKYNTGIPALQWLPWTPQLVSCLVQYQGDVISNLLTHVARVFPQAVYLPMRTLYLAIKIEQRVGYKSKMGVSDPGEQGGDQKQPQTPSSSSQPETPQLGSIRANPPLIRCTNLLRNVRDIHPIILQSLEGFVEEMSWFRETWYEEVLRQIRQCLVKCYAVAFENRANVNEAKITPHMSNFVLKLMTTFGTGIENFASSTREINSLASESLARRMKAAEEDPVFQKIKKQFTQDFNSSLLASMKLHSLIEKLKKWVKILENKTKFLPKSLLIEEKCRFLSNFSLKTTEVELPGEFLLPKHPHYFVRIARFMPKADIVQKHNTAARRLYIRGHNGKIYPYLVVIDGGRREERVLQLLRMLNLYLGKQKETSRRFLHFTVPRVVAVSPQIRLVEDNPASISLLDIFKKGCAKLNLDHSAPIALYYDRLASAQQRGTQASHSMLRDILKTVQTTNMVPKTMLKNWALQTFPSATDYWTFRKMFTLQLALACFAEYVLHLTRLNPDMMYLHQDSGLVNISYFKFDIDDSTGELHNNRPVSFRLTPNIIEFLTNIGVSGPLTASMIASARCLTTPNFKVQAILRAILKDEIITGHKKKLEAAAAAAMEANALGASSINATLQEKNISQEMETEQLINMVNKAVNVILGRLTGLANFDVNDSKVNTLVVCASSQDNLCRMDPAWHPWL